MGDIIEGNEGPVQGGFDPPKRLGQMAGGRQRQDVKSICVVSQWFDGDHATKGLAIYLRNLEGEILKDHDLTIHHVFMTHDPESRQRTEEMGKGRLVLHPVYQKLGSLNYFQPRTLMRASQVMQEVVDENDIDLVHIHSAYTPLGSIASKIAANEGIPSMITQHVIERTEIGKKLVGAMIAPGVRRRAILRAGVSLAAARTLGSSEVINIGTGIDTDLFNPDITDTEPLLEEYSQLRDKQIILLAGRVTPIKGQLELLKAYSQLPEDVRDAHTIAFAGVIEDAHYRERLESFIRENGLEDNVMFLGGIDSRPKMMALNKYAKILAVPSREEAGPISPMEAQAMKTPVVGFSVGGMREEVVSGVTGYLCTPGNIDEFRDRMLEVLTFPPERYAKMGEHARNHIVTNFSIKKVAEDQLLYYRWLKGQKRKR